MIGPVVGVARRGVRRAPRADDFRNSVRTVQFSVAVLAQSRSVLMFQTISGLSSGTFIPLTIGFVVLNLPPKWVVYGIAAYSLNLELSLNIAASIEGWFCDNWSWQWIFWDTALLAPLMMVVHPFRHATSADQSRAAEERGLGRYPVCLAWVQSAVCRARPGQPSRLAEFRPDQRVAAGWRTAAHRFRRAGADHRRGRGSICAMPRAATFRCCSF